MKLFEIEREINGKVPDERQRIHPKIAQERLGHSTITTTLDLYSHVVDTMQNDAVSKLDDAFRSVIKRKPNAGPKLG